VYSLPLLPFAFIADWYDEYNWSLLIWIALVYPALAISTKRWHDRNKSGWWNLVALIPCIGSVWSLIECGFLPGDEDANRFGPNPLKDKIEPSGSANPLPPSALGDR
jgi:uncharacterized membrane protein YhaH (DUF805 family)